MNQEALQRLKDLTERLKELNDQAHDQFTQRTRSENYEVDFYGEVKPFADAVLKVVDEWKPLVFEWIQTAHPKYIYFPQINDTYDNLTIISVTAFQKDTRRKRFLDTVSSIKYVLDLIIEQLS
ncbi:YppE family protein [Camelliibacillus cellulosilyticus]|uniref:YppE family protein n=1 Tax=Camelliibacillus cellulosilyticus TaxID=2174486 RepID=A0ABV9GLJ1_9BACL